MSGPPPLGYTEAPVNAPQPPESTESAPPPPAESTPAGTRVPTHRWGFGAFFIAEGVFLLVSVVLAAIFGDVRAGGHSLALALTLALPPVLAGAVAVMITLVRGNGPARDLGLRWHWPDVTAGFNIGLLGLLATTVATVVWTHWVGLNEANSSVGSLFEGVRLPPALAVLLFLHVWLVAPLCEELLYRGLLWGAMERLRWSPLTALLLTTAVFAIGHLEPSRTVLLLIIAIPIGVARMITGRLTASVIAHQVNNFLPALGLLLGSLGVLPA